MLKWSKKSGEFNTLRISFCFADLTDKSPHRLIPALVSAACGLFPCLYDRFPLAWLAIWNTQRHHRRHPGTLPLQFCRAAAEGSASCTPAPPRDLPCHDSAGLFLSLNAETSASLLAFFPLIILGVGTHEFIRVRKRPILLSGVTV